MATLVSFYQGRTLEQLKEDYNDVLAKSHDVVRGQIIKFLDSFQDVQIYKQNNPEIYETFLTLIDRDFTKSLRHAVWQMIQDLKTSSRGQTVAKAKAKSSIFDPTQKIKLPTFAKQPSPTPYVPPPRPIMKTVPKAMAILNDPQQPTKRDSSKIEGIDEREESPKSRAKTAPATQPKATPAIRSISSLEEQAKISTVLNDFFKNEVRALQSKNIDALDEHMEEKVNQQGELQKELDDFINRHQSLKTDVFVRNRSFLEQELKEQIRTKSNALNTNIIQNPTN